jgi:hypothetical protein
LSLAFVIFREYPATMGAISIQLKTLEAILSETNMSESPCCSLAGDNRVEEKIDDAIEYVDKKLAEYGLVSIAEFISDLIEVFCKYVNVDLNSSEEKLTPTFDMCVRTLEAVSKKFKIINTSYVEPTQRATSWGLLTLTEKILAKSEEFGPSGAPIRKLVHSYERFYKSMYRLNDDLEKLAKPMASVKDERGLGEKTASRVEINYQLESEKSPSKIQNLVSHVVAPAGIKLELATAAGTGMVVRYDRSSNLAPENTEVFRQIERIGRLFQQLELLLSCLIFGYKNEEEIIYPLCGHIDECTRIIEKYIRLHIAYKLVYGPAFLSKLKVTFKRAEDLMETSKLRVDSTRVMANELKLKYPELLCFLYETFLNVKIKAKLESLPDPVESELEKALKKILS